MRTGSQIQAVQINSCPLEHYWFNSHIGETVHVADSGEPDQWHIVTGVHEGKHVLKSVCSPAEMTLIELDKSRLMKMGA